MNKIDTEYASLADVPQSVVQYYSEETRTRVIGYEQSDDGETSTPITEEYIVVVLNRPDKVLYSDVAQRINEGKPRDVVDSELARAIEWEGFYYGHDLTLENEADYAQWKQEQPTEIVEDEEVLLPAPQMPLIDKEIRRGFYREIFEPWDMALNVSVDSKTSCDDDTYTKTTCQILERKPESEIAAYHGELAKVTRDNAMTSNISVFDVEWQVREQDRNNINEAINKAIRNNIDSSESRFWILADNSVRETTLSELGKIMDAYTERMDDIYMKYGIWRSGDKQSPFIYE